MPQHLAQRKDNVTPSAATLRAHWTLDPAVRFLNHGSFGACPRAVLDVQSALRAELEREPVLFMGREIEARVDAAKQALASFIGCDPHDLARIANATTGVNTVLSALLLGPGDEILVTDHGYMACNNAARRFAERGGAKLVVARVPFLTRTMTPFEVLSDEGLELIEHNADTILERVGIEFRDSPEARELLRSAGAEVEGERVRFPRGLCRQLVQATAPRTFTPYSCGRSVNAERTFSRSPLRVRVTGARRGRVTPFSVKLPLASPVTVCPDATRVGPSKRFRVKVAVGCSAAPRASRACWSRSAMPVFSDPRSTRTVARVACRSVKSRVPLLLRAFTLPVTGISVTRYANVTLASEARTAPCAPASSVALSSVAPSSALSRAGRVQGGGGARRSNRAAALAAGRPMTDRFTGVLLGGYARTWGGSGRVVPRCL